MYVVTSEAAKLLNMKAVRLGRLLLQGRVKGAYKSGRYWIIPLYDGLPRIIEGKEKKRNMEDPKSTIKNDRPH